MTNFTPAQRLRYWFDSTMSAGTVALIGWLFAVSALMILAFTLLVHVAGLAPAGDDGSRPGVTAIAWASLMRTLDAGTMGGDQGSWPYLFTMLGVTLGGVFVVGTLIGLLTSGIEGKIDEIRKGRSLVVENDHTVILGWTPEVFTIAQEVCTANSNRGRACIAVLADRDKVEMEDELRLRVESPGRTRLVCRTGNPSDLTDLALVNPAGARSIVVLNPGGHDGDSHVIKTVLALTNGPGRPTRPYHIVATLRDSRNLQVARMVGRDEAQFVVADDLIARITVQTCRQSGLSVVYTELLDFGGDEIYFHEEPRLVGATFGDALLAYEDSTIIGLRQADGRIRVNPPMDTPIGPGDRVIAISEDDDTVKLAATRAAVDAEAIRPAARRAPAPERTLLLGWNPRAALILRELDSYVAEGSEVMAVLPSEQAAADLRALPALRNCRLGHAVGDVTERDVLDGLAPGSYDHIICLSPGEVDDPQEADSRSLITLLHLRDIADRGSLDLSIVSEMRDVRNRELASVTRADDFIVSDRLISLLLAQVSENRELMAVFEDLFDPEGSEIYLKPAGDYVEPGREVSFATVVEAARRRGEVAIGYRRKGAADDAARAYGVVVNPKKSARVRLEADDKVVVLAEE